MTTNTSLAGGPATRRRRVSSVGFRLFTYGALVLIIAPAVWILLGVLFRALQPVYGVEAMARERGLDLPESPRPAQLRLISSVTRLHSSRGSTTRLERPDTSGRI